MHYNGCNYLSMLGLKLNHVSKRGHWCNKPSVKKGKLVFYTVWYILQYAAHLRVMHMIYSFFFFSHMIHSDFLLDILPPQFPGGQYEFSDEVCPAGHNILHWLIQSWLFFPFSWPATLDEMLQGAHLWPIKRHQADGAFSPRLAIALYVGREQFYSHI